MHIVTQIKLKALHLRKTKKKKVITHSTPKRASRVYYPDLQPESWLTSATLLQAMKQLVIKEKKDTSVFVADSQWNNWAQKGMHKPILEQCAGYLILEYDLILAPLNTNIEKGYHWLLGGIYFQEKIVFLVDSLIRNEEEIMQQIHNLIVIAGAAVITGGVLFEPEAWRSIYATDSPLQSYDCGVHVITNTLAVLCGIPFPHSIPDSNKTRNWIINLLQSKTDHEYTHRRLKNICYKPVEIKRFTNELKHGQSSLLHKEPLQQYMEKYMDTSNKDWTICGANDKCPGDFQHSDSQEMCVSCREWFHTKCANLQTCNDVKPQYKYCTRCLPRVIMTGILFYINLYSIFLSYTVLTRAVCKYFLIRLRFESKSQLFLKNCKFHLKIMILHKFTIFT